MYRLIKNAGFRIDFRRKNNPLFFGYPVAQFKRKHIAPLASYLIRLVFHQTNIYKVKVSIALLIIWVLHQWQYSSHEQILIYMYVGEFVNIGL